MLGMQNFSQTFSIIFLVCNNQKRAKPQTVQRNSSFIVLLYLLNGSLSWKASSKAQTNSTLPGDYQVLSQTHTRTESSRRSHNMWQGAPFYRCTLYTKKSHFHWPVMRAGYGAVHMPNVTFLLLRMELNTLLSGAQVGTTFIVFNGL